MRHRAQGCPALARRRAIADGWTIRLRNYEYVLIIDRGDSVPFHWRKLLPEPTPGDQHNGASLPPPSDGPPSVGTSSRLSDAELLLLRKFVGPASPSQFRGEVWNQVLTRPVERTISDFERSRLLVPATGSEVLESAFTAVALKALAKERGLPRSGRKRDIAVRLVQADPTGMAGLIKQLDLRICSDVGRAVALPYIERRDNERKQAEGDTLAFLAAQDFVSASRRVAQYEAAQVFSRGLGIDWANHNPATDVAVLETIYSRVPGILKGLNPTALPALRTGAAMSYLWGTGRSSPWMPADLVTGCRLDAETCARMFIFFGYSRRTLDEFFKNSYGVVHGAELLAAPDACPTCATLNGARFPPGEVPEIPHPDCTSTKGCRCTLLAVLDEL